LFLVICNEAAGIHMNATQNGHKACEARNLDVQSSRKRAILKRFTLIGLSLSQGHDPYWVVCHIRPRRRPFHIGGNR
jgi:hypothetical protein